MTKMKTAAFALLSLFLGACGGGPAGPPTESVTLLTQMGSGETGTAVLTDLGNDMTRIVITTTGGSDTGAEFAYIRTGTCASTGPIFVALQDVQGGTGTSTIPFSLTSLQGGKLYLAVNNSVDPMNVQCCGVIQ
jgi:hypothetical protein